MRRSVGIFLAVAALGLAACGGDDDEEAAVTPGQAIAEIAEVRAGLDEAVDAYEKGDSAGAEEAASEAYLQHFELVEGPLEEVDEELNEELEVLIRETLRDAIAAGEPVGEVKALVEEANEGLDEARSALKGAA